MGYDPLDHVASVTDPLGRATRYAYDANGNPTKVTDPKSNTTAYTFDGLRRDSVGIFNDRIRGHEVIREFGS